MEDHVSETAPQLSVKQSTEVAAVIALIAQYVQLIDHDYLKLLVQKMRDQAGRQEGLAVLLPKYPLKGNDLLRMQAKALSLLDQYIDTLKSIDVLKKELKHDQSLQNEIEKLFVNLQL